MALPLICHAYNACNARRRERERAVLRLAAYELKFRPDVPYRVVLNEAIEVTKRFGADHGHTYVNGVLDKLAGDLRAVEKRS
jgi:N utilization substance protein B